METKKALTGCLNGCAVVLLLVIVAVLLFISLFTAARLARDIKTMDVSDLAGITDKYDCELYLDTNTGSDFTVVGFYGNKNITIAKIVDARSESLFNFHEITSIRENLQHFLKTGLLAMPRMTVSYDSGEKDGGVMDYPQAIQLLDDFSKWTDLARQKNWLDISTERSQCLMSFKINHDHNAYMINYATNYYVQDDAGNWREGGFSEEDIPALRHCLNLSKKINAEFVIPTINEASNQIKKQEHDQQEANSLSN